MIHEASQHPEMAQQTLEILRSCQTGRMLLDHAAERGVKLLFTSQEGGSRYHVRSKTACASLNWDIEETVLLAIRALRDIYNDNLNPLQFHPDHAILLHRAQIADSVVFMISVAWELLLAGQRGFWERMAVSHSDICAAYSKAAQDFRMLRNGEAMLAAFEAWFLSSRSYEVDRETVKQMLADYKGYVFAEQRRDDIAEVIIKLGNAPGIKNYLSPHIQTIINDPVFNEVRNRSNCNFLWFIKFEQSFRADNRPVPTSRDNIIQATFEPKPVTCADGELVQLRRYKAWTYEWSPGGNAA